MRTHMLVTVAAALVLLGSNGARLDAQAATTVCKDGSTSATTGRGACSGHGGVDAKATAAAKKAATAKAKADAKAAKAQANAAKSEAKTAAKSEPKTEAKTAAKTEPKAAVQVTCADGTTSTAGRGACSGHGGVKKAAAATAAPSVPAAVPATSPARARSQAKSNAPTATQQSSNRGEDNDPTGAIAQCKDGLYSHATNRRGACSKHGGVAKWLKS